MRGPDVRKDLTRQALRMAIGVRRENGISQTETMDVFGLASDLGIEVLFQELRGAEGLYLREPGPLILISAMRPAGRQAYSCAHEIGHHAAGHGTAVDNELGQRVDSRSDEFLVEVFGGFLLMPPRLVRSAFRNRQQDPMSCSPVVFYKVASALGVGYMTLVHHAFWTLDLIDEARFGSLSRTRPKQIKSLLLNRNFTGDLVVVDEHWPDRPIDLRVGDLILTPDANVGPSSPVVLDGHTRDGVVLRGRAPGVSKLDLSGQPRIVRVSRYGYVGRAVNRFLEDPGFE